MDYLTLKTMYLVSGILGTSIMAIQMGLMMLGADGMDADMDVDGFESGDGMSLLSIRSVAGFMAVFGVTGWWGLTKDWSNGQTLGIAGGSGFLMMLSVAWIMSLHTKLYSEGTLRVGKAVGKVAKVYLRIPADKGGKGKITVSIDGRSAEFSAITAGEEIATGAEVTVLRQTTSDTFEVALLE